MTHFPFAIKVWQKYFGAESICGNHFIAVIIEQYFESGSHCLFVCAWPSTNSMQGIRFVGFLVAGSEIDIADHFEFKTRIKVVREWVLFKLLDQHQRDFSYFLTVSIFNTVFLRLSQFKIERVKITTPDHFLILSLSLIYFDIKLTVILLEGFLVNFKISKLEQSKICTLFALVEQSFIVFAMLGNHEAVGLLRTEKVIIFQGLHFKGCQSKFPASDLFIIFLLLFAHHLHTWSELFLLFSLRF